MTVEIVNYQNLPGDINKEELPNNGQGREYANYLVIWDGDTLIRCESDAMESEDAGFTRDLSWIKSALEHAYEIGRATELSKL